MSVSLSPSRTCSDALLRADGTTTFEPQSPADQAFANELIAYWLSFVRSGNPNRYRLPESPKWAVYAVNGINHARARIVLRELVQNSTKASGSYVELEPTQETKRCSLVASLADKQQA